jgi:hypothetical protein
MSEEESSYYGEQDDEPYVQTRFSNMNSFLGLGKKP